jgi:hypothetical protein
VEPTLQNELPTSATLQSRKRKRSQPVYMGEIMWEIATKTINRQKKTIAYIQKKSISPSEANKIIE